MLINLKLKGRRVLVLGGGQIGERKVKRFLDESSEIIVVSREFTEELKRLESKGKVELVKCNLESDISIINSLISRGDIVIIATDNEELNLKAAVIARERGVLVSVADRQDLSDFYLPAIKRIGGIQIAVSTDGRSPAMAKILRDRIGSIITEEDILQVNLQHYIRNLIKPLIPEGEKRKAVLYRIIRDMNIRDLLMNGRVEEAKKRARRIIREYMK